jgi:hypothetical protein
MGDLLSSKQLACQAIAVSLCGYNRELIVFKWRLWRLWRLSQGGQIKNQKPAAKWAAIPLVVFDRISHSSKWKRTCFAADKSIAT